MPNISITPVAIAKILADTQIFMNLRGPDMIPLFSYSTHGWYNLNDGRIIELGPSISLSFIGSAKAREFPYLVVDLKGGRKALFQPAEHFHTGTHCIDWVDRKFTLTSSPE